MEKLNEALKACAGNKVAEQAIRAAIKELENAQNTAVKTEIGGSSAMKPEIGGANAYANKQFLKDLRNAVVPFSKGSAAVAKIFVQALTDLQKGAGLNDEMMLTFISGKLGESERLQFEVWKKSLSVPTFAAWSTWFLDQPLLLHFSESARDRLAKASQGALSAEMFVRELALINHDVKDSAVKEIDFEKAFA
jgi:hypothetical protein